MMRVSLFVTGSNVKARALGQSDLRYISVEIGEATLFFEDYNEVNVEIARNLSRELALAAEQLECLIVQDAIEKKRVSEEELTDRLLDREDERTGHEQHDTLEEHRGER